MQIFYGIVVLLTCLTSGIIGQHVGIPYNCTLRPMCNGTNTSAVVCATNGQSCKVFTSECELHRENCNRTLATAWNRTASIQCTNLRSNTTGLCACSTQALTRLQCSNQTVTTGICAHDGFGHRCHLFRTECDIRRARCNGETWRILDNRQCRGFLFNRNNTCICPKLLDCSRNRTQQCVRVGAKGCRLYASECDVELQRCNGERLVDVDIKQCSGIQVGRFGNCHCPRLIHCQRNNTNICVRNAAGRCQLMGNECELEQLRCRGSVLTLAHSIQCGNLRPNQTGTCNCPGQLSCSRNITNICVQTPTGCELKRNACELELSRCRGQEIRNSSSLQCLGFQPGDSRPCTCPNLETCLRNNTRVCVRNSQGCMLLQDECTFEEENCRGANLTLVDAVQCRGLSRLNHLQNCTCPNLSNCESSSPNVCVAINSDQCHLLENKCELEKQRCLGRNLTEIDTLHCQNFTVNTTATCTCPSLQSCDRNSGSICARQPNNQCTLLPSNCDLEKAKCEGRNLTSVHPIECQSLNTNQTGICRCPGLQTCSVNRTNICVKLRTGCKLKANECELELARCQGQELRETSSLRCLGFHPGESRACTCPSVKNCSQNTTNLCAQTSRGCLLLENECKFEEEKCKGINLTLVDAVQCWGQSAYNQLRNCSCPNLGQCAESSPNICASVSANRCILLKNTCELEKQKCQGRNLTVVNTLHCQNFTVNATTTCTCPSLLNCNINSRPICVRDENRRCVFLRNNCDLESAKCEGRNITIVHDIQCSQLRPNATGTCHCTALDTCSRNRTNICVQTQTTCELKRNECDLELSRCQGQEFRSTSALQCLGFQPGERKPCACPNLKTCSRNNATICARTPQGCILLQNQCQLEEERCKGTNLTVINSLHCENFALNSLRNCSCPDLLSCSINSSSICVRQQNNRCQLLANNCELEKARCEGRNLTPAHPIQCSALSANETGTCTCPALQTCSLNRTNICVERGTDCELKPNECDLELSRCQGRDLSNTSSLHCLGFQTGERKPCTCPALRTCSRNNTRICARTGQSCILLHNECRFEEEKCRGANLTLMDGIHCREGFSYNQLRNCSCPNLIGCRETPPNICVQVATNQCRLLRNHCELERERCEGRNWTAISSLHCNNFSLRTTTACSCPGLLNCNRNSSPICVRQPDNRCLLLSNNCDYEQAKCEGRNITTVHDIQCSLLRPNVAGACRCTALDTCSRNRTNLCVQTQTGCELKRNECDLELSRCQGQEFQSTSSLQCLRFTPGERKPCTCPTLKTCSRNNATVCARTAQGCILLENQCKIEEERCRGTNLTITSSLHCRNFAVNSLRNCSCPDLLSCNTNSSSICVRQQNNHCQLLRNNCDLEKAKCEGRNITAVSTFNCQNLPIGTTRPCTCPTLFNCSSMQTRICIQANNSCKLLRTECEVEREKCRGIDLRVVSPLHCANFEFGQQRSCACPQLKTCNRNTTRICIKTGNGCKVLRNQCDLEELNCQGQNVTILPNPQCQSLRLGANGTCWCPNLLSCHRNSSQICTDSPQGCRLLRNRCEFEELKCQGQNINIADMLLCQNLGIGQLRPCACPLWRNCLRNNKQNICVRGQRGCMLMADTCELEKARCSGKKWTLENSLQCQNFAVGYIGPCTCPRLKSCSRATHRNICYQKQNLCKYLRNQCEVETSRCRGEGFMPTIQHRCQGIRVGTTATCRCPEMRRCNRRHTVCANNGTLCKLFRNECELRRAICQGEIWLQSSLESCCQLRVNETKDCTLTSREGVCGRARNNQCRLFNSLCEFDIANAKTRSGFTIVDRSQCRCVGTRRIGVCHIAPKCTAVERRRIAICTRYHNALRRFYSLCQLKLYNYQTCGNFQVVPGSMCQRIA